MAFNIGEKNFFPSRRQSYIYEAARHLLGTNFNSIHIPYEALFWEG